MKNNKLLYLLTIIITLFSFNMNARADGVDYYFKWSYGDTNKINTTLRDGLCMGTIKNSSEEDIPFTCTYYCSKDNFSFDATGTSALATKGFNSLWEQPNNYKNKCDTIEKYSIKGYETSDKLTEFKNELIGKEIQCGEKNCYNYIIEDYCSENSTEPICDALVKNASSANTIIDSAGNVKSVCQMEAKIYKKDSNITADEIKFEAVYEKSNDRLSFTYAYSDDYVNKGFKTNYNESYVEQYYNRFYMYSKGSTSDKFNEEYINQLNINENNNASTCPKVTFCMSEVKDGYYIWYAELGDNIDKSKYSICQTTDSDGISSGLDYEGANLIIDPDPTTLNLCDDILVENSVIWKLLRYLVILIRIAVPLLLIGLGIMDFAQAIFSGNEDGMKKAQTKFIKRLIIGICIFLIPSLLELILTIANGIWGNISSDFCGIL